MPHPDGSAAGIKAGKVDFAVSDFIITLRRLGKYSA